MMKPFCDVCGEPALKENTAIRVAVINGKDTTTVKIDLKSGGLSRLDLCINCYRHILARLDEAAMLQARTLDEAKRYEAKR